MEIEAIWKNFYKPLHQFVMKRTGNEFAADDILQNVFMNIYSYIGSLKNSQNLRSWIYQITRNAIADYYRKEKKHEELSKQRPSKEGEDESDVLKELAACVRPMVERLPGIYREALEWSELAGFTQKQLSEKLGISLSGAKSRVQRGREKLRDMMVQCCHFEFDRRGNMLAYTPKRDKSDNATNCSCGCS